MRKLSEHSLANVALHYLRRYSATRKGLKQMLERRVKNHVRLKGGDAASTVPMIEAVVARMVTAGYIDDARFAESKAGSLHRAGKGVRMVRLKLRQKGLEADVIAKVTPPNPEKEFEAALTLVRKKKLGVDPERKQKDLAVLMRGGFNYDVAKRALANRAVE
ncbi:MAG: regulatory protein RecX [Archangium sp.]